MPRFEARDLLRNNFVLFDLYDRNNRRFNGTKCIDLIGSVSISCSLLILDRSNDRRIGSLDEITAIPISSVRRVSNESNVYTILWSQLLLRFAKLLSRQKIPIDRLFPSEGIKRKRKSRTARTTTSYSRKRWRTSTDKFYIAKELQPNALLLTFVESCLYLRTIEERALRNAQKYFTCTKIR